MTVIFQIFVCLLVTVPQFSYAVEKTSPKRTVSSFDPFAPHAEDCFDPRKVLVRCENGKVFKGWWKGKCKGNLVQAANCADECFDPRSAFVQCQEPKEFKGWITGDCKNGLVEKADCQ